MLGDFIGQRGTPTHYASAPTLPGHIIDKFKGEGVQSCKGERKISAFSKLRQVHHGGPRKKRIILPHMRRYCRWAMAITRRRGGIEVKAKRQFLEIRLSFTRESHPRQKSRAYSRQRTSRSGRPF